MDLIMKILKFLRDNLDILALLASSYSIWYTRKRYTTPKIRVYVSNKKWPERCSGAGMAVYHNGPDKMLNIENVGETGITMIDIKVNEIPITEITNIINANYLINANLPPRNIASSECKNMKELLGKLVSIKVKTDEGKTSDLKVTLCEVY